MKTKQPRKPENFLYCDDVLHVDKNYSRGIVIKKGRTEYLDIWDLKELHTWLGKAIKYLEAKEKKK